MQPLEIYIHVPFCKRKCLYCDFFSGPFREEEQRIYFDNLIQEIKESPYSDRGFSVSSVFFGGGTPSSVDPSFPERVLAEIRTRFLVSEDAEITMECNPGAVYQDLSRYRSSGINRLSIGLQSTENELLRTIGRIHTYEDFLKTYREARRAGFDNISVDLMSGLPGQTVSDFEKGLMQVAGLSPEHISVYSLIIAENTPFYALYGAQEEARVRGDYDPANFAGGEKNSQACLPTEEEDRKMYECTERILGKYGYRRYEISNYALPGKECRHNTGYWTHVPYLGFGAAAASFIPDEENGRWLRYRNKEKLNYYEENYEEQEVLEKEDLMGEYMMLGLRMTDGICERDFEARFGSTVQDVFGSVIKKLAQSGLLTTTDGRIRLTKKGLDTANLVFMEFI